MKCSKVITMLSAYMDKELSSVAHHEIKEHLLQCSVCTAEYELLTKTCNSLSLWDEKVEVSPLFTQNLMRKIHNQKAVNLPFMVRIQNFLYPQIALPACAIVLLGIFLGHYAGDALYPYREDKASLIAHNNVVTSSHSLREHINSIDAYIFSEILD